MIVGCYTLDLYCENSNGWGCNPDKPESDPDQYTAELGSRCRRAARKDGWLLKRDGTAFVHTA